MANCSNTNPCPCPSATCQNKGKCCACVANHVKRGNLPVCLRPIAEAMYAAKKEDAKD